MNLADDTRIDPRIRAALGSIDAGTAGGDVDSREQLLAEVNAPDAVAQRAAMKAMIDASMDTEQVAPSAGLSVSEHAVVSQPDGNEIKIILVRPQEPGLLPCVNYVHGGGMSSQSCDDGQYRAFARLLAAHGVAVAMVEFRNSLIPSLVPDVAPFPAGLDDCVSGLRWVAQHAADLAIDARRIVACGESGGANLAIATALRLKQAGELELLAGLYAMCPYLAGSWPRAEFPSSAEFNGYVLDLHDNRGSTAYGSDELHHRNPLAWPGFATEDDVRGLVPTVITVNECDPLRDEGIAFYRLLLAAGVASRCRQAMGTVHGTEVLHLCPDITRDAVVSIADFARGARAPAR